MNEEEAIKTARNTVMVLLGVASPTQEQLRKTAEVAVDTVQKLHGVKLDVELLVRRLEAEFDVFQPDIDELVNNEGHLPWLDERIPQLEWKFFDRYMRYLREVEELPPIVLQRIESTTRKTLGALEDPHRPSVWSRRGMVVGQIQSGKTGNYIALLCRAVDAGYPIVVVLAGVDNNLRSQTQLRVDQGFLGFDTQIRNMLNIDADGGGGGARIGVATLAGQPVLPAASLTSSREEGDFKSHAAQQVGIMPGQGIPIVVVAKKHVTILENLRLWLVGLLLTNQDEKIESVPILVIDDEADHASINTQSADRDPTQTNKKIRQFLNSFERSVYVGYTATPYANIFIDNEATDPQLGNDLFPESFIWNLPPPDNYFGPKKLFGLSDDGDDELPLHRLVADTAMWIPDKHKKDHVPGPIPESLRNAIKAFVLVRAARLARGQTKKHNSMLVHVTRYVKVQNAVASQVGDEIEQLKARINFGDGDGARIEDELRKIWESDFLVTTAAMTDEIELLQWDRIAPFLNEAVNSIVIKIINGDAKDSLQYFENRVNGLNVIAVGGQRLSRGLTLDGLSISYYLRTTRMHDTLLQMARWFGYRPGYEDLVRLWTTRTLWTSYRKVTLANERLIEDFEDMARRGKTPRDFGLKMLNNIEGWLVTAANKMRHGLKLRVGYADSFPVTTTILADRKTAESNLEVTDAFIKQVVRLAAAGIAIPSKEKGNFVWSNVPADTVITYFFEKFATAISAYNVNGQKIAEFIRLQNKRMALTKWTVVLASNESKVHGFGTVGGCQVNFVKRSLPNSRNAGNGVDEYIEDLRTTGIYTVKSVASPDDEAIDLSVSQRHEALLETKERWQANGAKKNEPQRPSGASIRSRRLPERGLLIIYTLAPIANMYVGSTANSTILEKINAPNPDVEVTTGPIVGFGASFPADSDAPKIDWIVTKQFLSEFYGVDQLDDVEDEED